MPVSPQNTQAQKQLTEVKHPQIFLSIFTEVIKSSPERTLTAELTTFSPCSWETPVAGPPLGQKRGRLEPGPSLGAGLRAAGV